MLEKSTAGHAVCIQFVETSQQCMVPILYYILSVLTLLI